MEEAEARPNSSQIRWSQLGGGHSSGGSGRRRRLGCTPGRSTAAAPPASSPATAPSHGCYAGRRRVLLAVSEGDGSGRLGGVHRPQAVRSDGEGARISRLYLTQLGPQGLWEALHEEVVEGEVLSGGLVSISATRLSVPAMCWMWLVNSGIYANLQHCLAIQGSVNLQRAVVSGL